MEKAVPITKMKIHTARNLKSFASDFHPKIPRAVYAAAKGAVMEEDIPAAKSPVA